MTEIERLTLENWQLKGALGYAVPGDIPEGNFKCGLCDAKTRGIIEAEAENVRLRAENARLRASINSGPLIPPIKSSEK